ncbi:hypothetical protein RN001_011856 [Aquatica leii]|uniref:Uncharacterized protein n=1 Tax=Aquatica leii TaxID=1421715 RepID=A0AAN7PSB2_9COLE|nr:hypothetical protein RN001_011856 [Aquatica leii]
MHLLKKSIINKLHLNFYDEEEEYRILKAAGKILRRHIQKHVYDNNIYPASDKMFDNVNESIPKSFIFFLSEIILNDKRGKPKCISYYETKCTSIAHAIISAVRLRSFISSRDIRCYSS